MESVSECKHLAAGLAGVFNLNLITVAFLNYQHGYAQLECSHFIIAVYENLFVDLNTSTQKYYKMETISTKKKQERNEKMNQNHANKHISSAYLEK